jgi:hypothetical protein
MITKTNLANFWRNERMRKNDQVEPKNDNEINSQGKESQEELILLPREP